MVIGVGLFGTLSGLVVSPFLGESEDKIEKEETELRAFRAEVAKLRRGPGFPARGSNPAENHPPAPPS